MLIKNGKVFINNDHFEKVNILIQNDKIMSLDSVEAAKNPGISNADIEIIDAQNMLVIPGLIDIHLHGAKGYDCSDASTEKLTDFLRFEISSGVTSLCPTTMSYPIDRLKMIISEINSMNISPLLSEIRGFNIEGPFLNPSKCGAQNPEYLSSPDICSFKGLINSVTGIKIVSISPELPGAMDFINTFKSSVNISLGHTECDYDTALDAFNNGVKHITHLGNAMNPMLSRFPGPIVAAFEKKETMVELITDGIHLHPAMVRMFFSLFGSDRIIMISDSMRACGLSDGAYDLGGQIVSVKYPHAFLENGTIAGSVNTLMDNLRICVNKIGIPIESALKCCTLNPAKAINESNSIGSIEVGKQADLLIVDEKLNIHKVIKKGCTL